jgi:hypothetical protein
MDIKQKIQELSLDQKAKLYYMALLQKGMIDRLPEDPKAAYVRDMMDKEDPKMDPAIRSDFDDPMFENLTEIATKLGYLNEEENYQNLPKPDKINLSYTDPGFRFYGMYLYKDGNRFAKISYEDRATKYLKNLGVNTEIPRRFDTDILDKIEQEIEALGIKGDYDAAMDVS